MNCDFHPREEAKAVCDGCGRALCFQCMQRVSGKSYCERCAGVLLGEPVQSADRPGVVWYLLPVLFGIIGGVICYWIFRKQNAKIATDLLLIGLVFNVVWMTLAYYLGYGFFYELAGNKI